MASLSKIGEKTAIVGNVHGDGDLEVLGRVSGDITVEGSVLIGSSGVVSGAVSAAVIRVSGKIEGKLDATETISIEPEAHVLGDMTTPRVSIAEGAVVRGMLCTETKPTPLAQPKAKAARVPEITTKEIKAARVVPPQPKPAPQTHEAARESDVTPNIEPLQHKKDKSKDKRPPEPRVPALAKGTKGKKKGDKR